MPVQCSNCGTSNVDNATFCTSCGASISGAQVPPPGISAGTQFQQKVCVNCRRPINVTFAICPYCGVVQSAGYPMAGYVPQIGAHNKVTAGILGILLGTFGVHKFYLNQTGTGVLYLVLCWTGIPTIIGFIEGIIYLTMNDQEFYYKYH